jgi:hypothetical protein
MHGNAMKRVGTVETRTAAYAHAITAGGGKRTYRPIYAYRYVDNMDRLMHSMHMQSLPLYCDHVRVTLHS